MKINKIHPAFATPERSLRRKMSAKMAMKIQIAIIQKNSASIVHSTLPTFHSVASTGTPPVDGVRAQSVAEEGGGAARGRRSGGLAGRAGLGGGCQAAASTLPARRTSNAIAISPMQWNIAMTATQPKKKS